MSKGEQTRATIVEQSLDLAGVLGLTALSIGTLAERTGMSKSGLFAHFGSKEALQLSVLDAAEQKFVDTVIKPAFQAPRGIARIRALFDRKLEWGKSWAGRGGCVFHASATEFDDRPGPVRDRLVAALRAFRQTVVSTAQGAVKTGEFAPDLDCEQFAYDFASIGLGYDHASRLMHDPEAERRARIAFDRLIRDSQAKP